MPLVTPIYRVPGIGLPTPVAVRIAAEISTGSGWFLYGMLAPYGITGADGRPPLARHGLSWPAGGIWLRDDHDGPILGSSIELWETANGMLGVFELNDDPAVRKAVYRAVDRGASFSAGYSVTATGPSGEHYGTITEASIVDEPAHPDSVIGGLYTPDLIAAVGPDGWTTTPGPRFSDYAAEGQLLEQLDRDDIDDAGRLALLNTLPTGSPARTLVIEARTTYTPALARPNTRRAIETIHTPLEPIETRRAGGRNYLECRCVPYGEVTDLTAGRRPERFHPGAFADVDPRKIKLTDENHSTGRRPVGFAERLDDRPDGLYGSFRFANTPEGRGAYENVLEGTYGGVSVGFIAMDAPTIGGIREIRRARLHHVSLVDTPAYNGAQILTVRNASP